MDLYIIEAKVVAAAWGTYCFNDLKIGWFAPGRFEE